MTVKGTTVYLTAEDIINTRLGADKVTELEDTLAAAGYELFVETLAAK